MTDDQQTDAFDALDTIDYKLVNPSFSDDAHANSPPIYQSITFDFDIDRPANQQYLYSRLGNPTTDILNQQLARLDQASYSYAVSSGMTAIHTLFSLLNEHDTLVVGQDIYGGTYKILQEFQKHKKLNVIRVDTTDLDQVQTTLKQQPVRFFWLESPTNPLQIISDIKQLAEITAQYDTYLVVDNSFLSSYLQKPLNFGVDIVIQSLTKHIGGFSDAIGGSISTNRPELARMIRTQLNINGALLSASAAWLFIRSLKTLRLRMMAQQSNALEIARYLQSFPSIKQVIYPGLTEHSGHQLNAQQASGAGSVISFIPESDEMALSIIRRSKNRIKVSGSFGSVATTISKPSLMSHQMAFVGDASQYPFDAALIRLSIGIEPLESIISLIDAILPS